ncbi:MAG TPA: hypothetical protein V6D17_09970 [Candidatus Obscuribacterales bacterium]
MNPQLTSPLSRFALRRLTLGTSLSLRIKRTVSSEPFGKTIGVAEITSPKAISRETLGEMQSWQDCYLSRFVSKSSPLSAEEHPIERERRQPSDIAARLSRTRLPALQPIKPSERGN